YFNELSIFVVYRGFFDSFEPMSAAVFENQRKAEGICRQAIVIGDRNLNIHSTKLN
ncbi:hypothetical protein LT215_003916, partial [Acinetobacter baumannii]